jgi:DinB superfamily
MDDLRYPVGRFSAPDPITSALHERFIREIEEAPTRLRDAVAGLSEEQLETPYRPDSHLNAYVRFKLALTEDGPTIRPYFEDRWAELPEARTGPVEMSLGLLEALHRRWTVMLRAVSPAEWTHTFQHPERGRVRLDQNLALYAWHGRHHVAHITSLRERMGWK